MSTDKPHGTLAESDATTDDGRVKFAVLQKHGDGSDGGDA